MSDVKLTREAEKMLVIVYQEYLARQKDGVPKVRAKSFAGFSEWSKRLFPDIESEDILETQHELCRAFGMIQYSRGGFTLNDDTIVYMQQRFPNGAKELLECLRQLKMRFLLLKHI